MTEGRQAAYPVSEFGFKVVGIDEYLYGPLLTHRLDNGVPEWAATDSTMGLALLGGQRLPAAHMQLALTEARLRYLVRSHGETVGASGPEGLDPRAFARAVQAKVADGLIYNLRFILGSRNGVADPALDATMFSVQVEFQDTNARVQRV